MTTSEPVSPRVPCNLRWLDRAALPNALISTSIFHTTMTSVADAKIKHRIALRGDAILTSPRWNKGTAFTLDERRVFGLTGRLPYRVNTLDEQCDRAYDQLESRDEPLRKNTFLQSLKDQNWVLYYTLLSRHLTELIPIIYTPTEVWVCLACCFMVGTDVTVC